MLQIDYRSGESLYAQIKENFKRLILSKSLKEDEMLPSVRTLASTLAINVNTVQRAYRELEQEGYIYSVPGKGNFVAREDNLIKQKGIDEVRNKVSELIDKAKYLGISKENFIDLVSEQYEGGDRK